MTVTVLRLNYSDGTVVADWLFRNSSWADVPDRDAASLWMWIAVTELCPWHDHQYTGVYVPRAESLI